MNTIMNLLTEDALNYLQSGGTIDWSQMQEEYNEMLKRNEILSKHKNSIYQRKGDMRWTTSVPNPSSKSGRKMITRVNKKDLEDAIVEHYKKLECEDDISKSEPTVKEMFKAWEEYKLDVGEHKKQTYDRNCRLVKQCFGSFGDRRISTVSDMDLDEFLVKTVNECHLTTKNFSNLKGIIKGVFKRAKRLGYIDFSVQNVLSDLDISRKSFKKIEKDDYELAYPTDEREKYMTYLWDRITDARQAALYLCFISGLRPGEIVALKHEDIDIENNTVSVRRAEERAKVDGKDAYFVGECKTQNAIRDVYINKKYNRFLKILKKMNTNDEYIFMWKNRRMRVYILDQMNETNCNRLGFIRRSVNKIRKTYASLLYSQGLDDELIKALMGHSEILTTQKSYVKDIRTTDEKMEIINAIAI